MSEHFDCSRPDVRLRGLGAAAAAVGEGKLVVLPTDTVYGIGCDAFQPAAVRALLRAKGRGPDMPVPVLIGDVAALDALTRGLPLAARELAARFWPGALTLICPAQPTLHWELGETGGTVALRMPDSPLALELLRAVGPMAVSSANRSGTPPATEADAAASSLGDAVAVYLDGGPTPGETPSTIVDLTVSPPKVLRAGALSVEALREVLPGVQVPQ